MLQDIFDTLGFKEEESKTYLSLLDSGPQTAGDLAKITGQARPTLYGYLDRLVQAGLVTQSAKGGVKIFAPEPPAKIRVLYRRRIMDMRRKEQSLDQILPELEKRAGLNLMRPRMQFFEGTAALEAALEDILRIPEGSQTYSLLPIQTVLDAVGHDVFARYNMRRIRKNIQVKGLWPRGQDVDIAAHPYLGWGPEFKGELRYAPLGAEFSMGYWVYGSRVLFISSRAESYGFIMESAEMAAMMTAQHQLIWQESEPVPFDRKFVESFLKDIADAA
ncbi:MAG: helix-turn-helix domain-containing protein [Alphaproteobacteria bacterium]|nr:helix-turn-helix domain-containing protein [Alphaproteobacteria bacterium]